MSGHPGIDITKFPAPYLNLRDYPVPVGPDTPNDQNTQNWQFIFAVSKHAVPVPWPPHNFNRVEYAVFGVDPYSSGSQHQQDTQKIKQALNSCSAMNQASNQASWGSPPDMWSPDDKTAAQVNRYVHWVNQQYVGRTES